MACTSLIGDFYETFPKNHMKDHVFPCFPVTGNMTDTSGMPYLCGFRGSDRSTIRIILIMRTHYFTENRTFLSIFHKHFIPSQPDHDHDRAERPQRHSDDMDGTF